MRFAGRITEWNDQKGFGFVFPNGGGTRAFVHIRQFQGRSHRPAIGDLILYLPVVDVRGRINAQNALHVVVKKVEAAGPVSRLPRARLGAGALAFAGISCAFGALPTLLLAIYFGMSVLSYLMYGWNKGYVQSRRSRTPESCLHMTGILGGWPGALIAQQHFRHKTIKQSFQFAFWLTVVVKLAACAWLVGSGLAAKLTPSVLG